MCEWANSALCSSSYMIARLFDIHGVFFLWLHSAFLNGNNNNNVKMIRNHRNRTSLWSNRHNHIHIHITHTHTYIHIWWQVAIENWTYANFWTAFNERRPFNLSSSSHLACIILSNLTQSKSKRTVGQMRSARICIFWISSVDAHLKLQQFDRHFNWVSVASAHFGKLFFFCFWTA